jgi:hypothetical protein
MKSAEARLLRASSSLPGKLQPTSPLPSQSKGSDVVVVVSDEPVQGNRRHAHDRLAHVRPFVILQLQPFRGRSTSSSRPSGGPTVNTSGIGCAACSSSSDRPAREESSHRTLRTRAKDLGSLPAPRRYDSRQSSPR